MFTEEHYLRALWQGSVKDGARYVFWNRQGLACFNTSLLTKHIELVGGFEELVNFPIL